MASSFFRTEFAGSFLANKRLKIDNDKSFMEKLPGDLSICVSEFLVSIKPYDINPRHKYDESNLRKIKESKSDILTDLASLIIASKRSRLYYSDLMKLLKLHYYIKEYSKKYLDVKLLASRFDIPILLQSPVDTFRYAVLDRQFTGYLKYDGGGQISDTRGWEIGCFAFTNLSAVPIENLIVDDKIHWADNEEEIPIPEMYKLPIKTVQISPAAIMRFKIPCIPMIGLRINEFISIDDNTFLFDTETFPVLSKKNVNIVIDDRPDREIDDDEFSHMLLYPNLSLKDFKELVSQKSGRAIFG